MTDRVPVPEHGEPAGLPSGLADAVTLLREASEPSSAWRAGVVAAAMDGASRPGAFAERHIMRIALAAGLAGVVVGGATVWTAMRSSRTPAPEAATALAPQPAIGTVRFTLVAPRAARVSVVGDFNHWDPARTPMRRAGGNGHWEITVPLAPGRYEYSFMVDGVIATDPSAPRATQGDFGAPNSIVFVRGSS